MPALEDARAQGSGWARDVPRASARVKAGCRACGVPRAGAHTIVGDRDQLSAGGHRGILADRSPTPSRAAFG